MEEVVGFVFQVEVEMPQVSQVTDTEGNEVSVATLEAMLAAGSGEGTAEPTNEESVAARSEPAAVPADDDSAPDTKPAATESSRTGSSRTGSSRTEAEKEKLAIRGAGGSGTPSRLSYSAPGEDGDPERVTRTENDEDQAYAGTGRNQPCPCGSGKKFKQCHGKKS